MTPEELLAAAYALDSPAANKALYAEWAETYEDEFIAASRYIYPERVAAVFAEHASSTLDSSESIVDIGCGTGLAGVAVRELMEVTIDGVDISPEMIEKAAGKQHAGAPVYRRLIEADLTQPLAIQTGTYAGAISVGTFTHGHVGPEALLEVVGIVRAGGPVAIGINAAHFAETEFAAMLDRLVTSGAISDLQLIDVPIYLDADGSDPDKFAHVALFRVG